MWAMLSDTAEMALPSNLCADLKRSGGAGKVRTKDPGHQTTGAPESVPLRSLRGMERRFQRCSALVPSRQDFKCLLNKLYGARRRLLSSFPELGVVNSRRPEHIAILRDCIDRQVDAEREPRLSRWQTRINRSDKFRTAWVKRRVQQHREALPQQLQDLHQFADVALHPSHVLETAKVGCTLEKARS